MTSGDKAGDSGAVLSLIRSPQGRSRRQPTLTARVESWAQNQHSDQHRQTIPFETNLLLFVKRISENNTLL